MISTSILKKLQKPGRYLGSEINAIKKKNKLFKTKVVLAFPDLYEIGMSHQGLQILYNILNSNKKIVCERVFSPAEDLEQIIRDERKTFSSLESNIPLNKFDILGFSLQYELGYSNVLTILDLANIPIFSKDRKNNFPLVIGGGPCTANPEVMADFFDLFVIGDGEEVFLSIIDVYRRASSNKQKMLFEMSKLKGVYVPSFYHEKFDKFNSNKFVGIVPEFSNLKNIVEKVTVEDLDKVAYPEKPVVPLINTVHDRACVEVMRGCPHSCNFCQARKYYSPVRVRKQDTVLNLAEQIIANTGYDELNLLSLSTGNYPQIEELLKCLIDLFEFKRVSLAMPSIRVEKLVKILPFYMSLGRRSGLTFAPEAGTERLRCFIGKNINIEYLEEAVFQAFRNNYKHVKLYFMIGLPTETYEDLDGIVELVFKLARLRMRIAKKPGQINVSIGTFVPKSHTNFEKVEMDSVESIKAKQEYLREKFNKRYIKYSFTDTEVSVLEAVLARGDRSISRVIYRAWKAGARFDGWGDKLKFGLWQQAFKEEGKNIEEYARGMFLAGSATPWEHIKL